MTNKAAELLFANISAEKVLSSYKNNPPCPSRAVFKKNHPCEVYARKQVSEDKTEGHQSPNFYMIWLILLNMLFQHGKNSPFKFKVTVDTDKDWENGRLEMLSVSLPAFTGTPSV